MLTRKLHLGEITIYALNEGEATFWEKHLPGGPMIYPQYFCFCDSEVFCKGVRNHKSSLVSKNHIIIPALNKT